MSNEQYIGICTNGNSWTIIKIFNLDDELIHLYTRDSYYILYIPYSC